jgi:hypothetical protein
MRTFLSFTFIAALAASSVPAFAQTAAGTAAVPKCPASDPVVWLNTDSKVFHVQGDRYFGTTKSGKYECRSQATAEGGRASKEQGKAGGTSATVAATPTPAAKRSLRSKLFGAPAAVTPAAVTATATPPATTKRHHKSKVTPAPAALAPGAAATATPVGSKHSRKHKPASPAAGAAPTATPAAKKRHHKSKATPTPAAAATASAK